MAGPCSVESRDQIERSAEAVARAGAAVIRGGAFKPRSSPYAFQGLGEDGLRLLREAADRNGLLAVSEVMDQTQNSPCGSLCRHPAGRRAQHAELHFASPNWGNSGKPVLLKRGISATIEEMLLSAEYILSGGNYDVILCERGIRTFETYTRNTMDISAIPVAHKLSHLPIVADPSHGTGRRDKVSAHGARSRGRRGRWPVGGSAPRSGSRAERWRAVVAVRAVSGADGAITNHRSGGWPAHGGAQGLRPPS